MPEFNEQVPFENIEFAENPEPRCPCVLLLDTSSSMKGKPIFELNNGLMCLKEELREDEMAVKRIEIAVITFGPVNVVNDFKSADVFDPPVFKTGNHTPMGAAIEQGVKMIWQRKELYKKNGISYYRPWIFLITDGKPTDKCNNAIKMIKQGEEAKSFMFFAVGVKGANMKTLSKISVREPLKLKELRFKELFIWLSNSLSSISHSNPEDGIKLLNPASPDGWAEAE